MTDRRRHRPDYMGFFLPLLGLGFALWFVVGRS